MALWLLFLGCTPENTLTELEVPAPVALQGCISVEPEELVFGAVEVGRSPGRIESLTLANDCEGDVVIEAMAVSSPEVYSLGPVNHGLLLGGEHLALDVLFDPPSHHEGPDALRIRTQVGRLAVPLHGEGIAAHLVTEPFLELPLGTTGCTGRTPLTLHNQGNATLEISDLQLTDTSGGMSLEQPPLPLEVAPGEQVVLIMQYLPLDTLRDVGTLGITSNDPARPLVEVRITGNGTDEGLLREELEALGDAVDVLWTIDRSGSTEPSILAAYYLGSFRDALHETGVDYHIAAAAEDDGCILGEYAYIDDSFSSSEAEEILFTQADIYLELGTYGANTERGFTLAMAALSEENTGPGGCNEGLLRDEAALVVVHTSDEPEQSTFSWEVYVPWVQGLKVDPSAVRVHAIAGDMPRGCGSAMAGYGYWEAVEATGGYFLSACTWGGPGESGNAYITGMELLAEASVVSWASYRPTTEPMPGTLSIRVDGLTTEHWAWEPEAGLVVFEDEHLPEAGATVELAYRPVGDCGS